MQSPRQQDPLTLFSPCFRSSAYTSSPMSSLTKKTSWERPSSLYSTGSGETSYTKPSYSSTTNGGDSGYSSKYSSTSSSGTDYKPSWRSSLASSDSNSSIGKYSSRPVSTVSDIVSETVSRFEAATPTPRNSWRDTYKETPETKPTNYGSLKSDSALGRYSSLGQEEELVEEKHQVP